MTNVSEWSVTAGNNNSSPPDGWPEGMARSAVNDCAREMMASLAQWYQDSNGTLTSAGGTLAYTLTTNCVHTALNDIPILAFRVNAANTGTVTLNVDGLGAKPWRKDASLSNYASGELALNQLVVVAYNSSEDDFFTVGPPSDSAISAGTAMVFYQASVPTGWTAVAQNNKALRVVTSGTTGGTAGGTTAFTSVFTARTIALANLPSTNLSLASTSLPNHGHSDSFGVTINNGGAWVLSNSNVDNVQTGGSVDNVPRDTTSLVISATVTGSVGNPTSNPAIGGTLPLGGSGTAVDFAVQYIDVCVGTKN